jgi:hypothetical protein
VVRGEPSEGGLRIGRLHGGPAPAEQKNRAQAEQQMIFLHQQLYFLIFGLFDLLKKLTGFRLAFFFILIL